MTKRVLSVHMGYARDGRERRLSAVLNGVGYASRRARSVENSILDRLRWCRSSTFARFLRTSEHSVLSSLRASKGDLEPQRASQSLLAAIKMGTSVGDQGRWSVAGQEEDVAVLDLAGFVEECGEGAGDCGCVGAVLGEGLGRDKDEASVRPAGGAVLGVEGHEVFDVGGDQGASGCCCAGECLIVGEETRPQLKAILGRCPELDALHGCIRGFAVMLTRRRGERLPGWLDQARAIGLPGLNSFVTGIEHDVAAVTAGLTQPWNSGPVEGHVNRIKMLKRQMYGRASLDLLRKRVLMTP